MVLFAADLRVKKYAQDIQELFLEKGVNCFTQMELEGQEFIKPENLIEVISQSTADYLIVIGDRNMKNRTCHAKKSGKLVEVSVDERLASILNEWNSNSNNKTSILNKDISELNKTQLQELIQLFTGTKYLVDRYTRLKKCKFLFILIISSDSRP